MSTKTYVYNQQVMSHEDLRILVMRRYLYIDFIRLQEFRLQ